MSEVSKRYAYSLVSVAKDEDKIETYKNEVSSLLSLLRKNKEYTQMLSSPFLNVDKRLELVKKIVEPFNKNIQNFIFIIVKNNRANILEDILLDCISLSNDQLGIKEGLLYSAFKLSENEIETIENTLSKVEKRKIELKNIIDKSLIGGVKIVLGDKIYDGSIKEKLKQMRNELKTAGGNNDGN